MKILVRATNWIGDAVMSLPALRALRSRYPDAEIKLLARPWVADLYLGESCIDAIIPMTATAGWKDFSAKWRLASLLRREKFDLAILLPNSFESAAIVWLAGIPKRVGYARDGRGLLLTDAIAVPAPRHERYYYPELLLRAGLIDEVPLIDEIRFEKSDTGRGRQLFEARGMTLPVVGVSPGAAYGNAKRWLPERFAEAACALGEHVVVFGSEAERGLCEQVASAANGVSVAGQTTLRDFIDMVAACRVFLCNDSGAMHIAAALGVPSVTVFGPTDETGTGPSSRTARIVREPVECSPCKLRECPIDHRCMTRVTAERVVLAARELD